MQFQDLVYQKRGAAAWIRINRPNELNAMTNLFLTEARQALACAEADPEVRAVVLTASGRAFCAGADLKFVFELPPEQREAESNDFVARASALMDRIEQFSKPVIAAVNGIAIAGGMELVLCCDIVIAAHSARLGDGHSNYGLLPGAGASLRLPRKIGANRANYLFFTGDLLPAEDFIAAGLVNQVVSDDALDATVDALVAKISAKSPLGLARMKAMAVASFDASSAVAIAHEQIVSQLHNKSHDRNEGIIAFAERRKPAFKGY